MNDQTKDSIEKIADEMLEEAKDDEYLGCLASIACTEVRAWANRLRALPQPSATAQEAVNELPTMIADAIDQDDKTTAKKYLTRLWNMRRMRGSCACVWKLDEDGEPESVEFPCGAHLEWAESLAPPSQPAPETAAQASVPEGWQLVPKEATRTMCARAVTFINGDAVYKNVAAAALEVEERIYGEVYESMLAAAPRSTEIGR